MPANGSTIDANRRPNILKYNAMLAAICDKLTPEEAQWLRKQLYKKESTATHVQATRLNNAALQSAIRHLTFRLNELERQTINETANKTAPAPARHEPPRIRTHNILKNTPAKKQTSR